MSLSRMLCLWYLKLVLDDFYKCSGIVDCFESFPKSNNFFEIFFSFSETFFLWRQILPHKCTNF